MHDMASSPRVPALLEPQQLSEKVRMGGVDLRSLASVQLPQQPLDGGDGICTTWPVHQESRHFLNLNNFLKKVRMDDGLVASTSGL